MRRVRPRAWRRRWRAWRAWGRRWRWGPGRHHKVIKACRRAKKAAEAQGDSLCVPAASRRQLRTSLYTHARTHTLDTFRQST